MNPEFIAWLTNPLFDANRTILIELEHSAGTVHLSTLPYLSETGIPYDAWLLEEPVLEETLEGHTSVGDFSVINYENPDVWQGYHWSGRECRLYIGDVSWPKSAFSGLATAIIEDVRRDGLTFTFDIVDRGFLLERNIQQQDIDVRGESKEIPLSFGHLFNVSPVLVDYPNQIYQVHDAAVLAIEPRDNGIPVGYTALLSAGKFKLDHQPVGTLSCGVEQQAATVLAIVQEIARRAGFELVHYGTQSWQRLAVAGLYVTGEPTFASLLDELASAVGCWWRLDGLGRIELISDQSEPLNITLTDDDVLDLQPSNLERPANKITLRYAPNHVVLSEDALAGAVEAGVVSALQSQHLTQADSVMTLLTHASTGLFDSLIEHKSIVVDTDSATMLMDILQQRQGTERRRWTGQMRSVAWGLRVGDRIHVNCEDAHGVGLVTRLARARSSGLTDIELLI
jgi:hypothetical protein